MYPPEIKTKVWEGLISQSFEISKNIQKSFSKVQRSAHPLAWNFKPTNLIKTLGWVFKIRDNTPLFPAQSVFFIFQ